MARTPDDRGNLIGSSDGTQYQYDAQDRMVGVTLPDTSVITYEYDADGRRVGQTVNGQTTEYVWDERSPYGDVVLETDAANVPQAAYTLADGRILAQTRGGVNSYYLADGQGSTRALTNSTGAITDTYSYTAFGEIYSQTGSTANNYLYTGQQFDALTGLYSLRARYYDPGQGRFLSRDTYPYDFQNPVEINRYGYAANNPVNRLDPSGNSSFFEGALNSLNSLVTTRVGVAGVGGFFFGGVGAFLIYSLASTRMCSDEMYEWTQRLDPVKFVGLAAGLGTAAALLFASMPPGSEGLAVTLAIGGTSAYFSTQTAVQETVNKGGPSICATMEAIGGAVGLFGGAGGAGTLTFTASSGGALAIGGTALSVSGVTGAAAGGLVGIVAAALLATTSGNGSGDNRRPLTADEQKQIDRINRTPQFLQDHPDIEKEAKILNNGGQLPGKHNHVEEAIQWRRSIDKAVDTLLRVRRNIDDSGQAQIDQAVTDARRYIAELDRRISAR